MLLFILLYATALVLLGWWASRRASVQDFFVAGRQLSPWLLASTLVAANIGAGSTVGAAGLGYGDGLAAWWWVGAAGVGSAVLALVVGPRMWRVAAEAGHRTLGDYLHARFGAEARALMAALLWFGSLAILSAQLMALAGLLETVAGIPYRTGCILGGVVATAYFATGGLLSSAVVNAAQVVVLLVGLSLAVPFAWAHAGGLPPVDAAGLPETYRNVWQSGSSGLTYLLLLGPSFIVSPGLLQKVYGARDARAVRIGVGLNALVLVGFAIVPVLLGMLARTTHPELTRPDLALPLLLRDDLPAWLGGLALAALFSAEVSTADAVLFMLSTSLARDLYVGHLRPRATDAEQLRAVRVAAVASGVFGVVLAVGAGGIASTMKVFYGLLSGGLFVPVIAGLFVPTAGRSHALAAMGTGAAVTGTLHLLTGGAGYAGGDPVFWGLISSLLAFGVAWVVVRQPRRATATNAATTSGSKAPPAS